MSAIDLRSITAQFSWRGEGRRGSCWGSIEGYEGVKWGESSGRQQHTYGALATTTKDFS